MKLGTLKAVLGLTICLVLILTGCTGEEKSAGFVPPERVIAEDGTTEFIIIRPEEATKEEIAVATTLRDLLRDATGAEITLRDDFVREGTAFTEQDAEILVGLTNREESVRASEGLKADDYRITWDGTKLVIAFGSVEAGMAALDRFAGECVFPERKLSGTPADYRCEAFGEYALDTIRIGARDVSEYTIVGESDFTDAVRDAITEVTGIVLRTSPITTKKGPMIRADVFEELGSREGAVRMIGDDLVLGTSGAIFEPKEAASLLTDLIRTCGGEIAADLNVRRTVEREAVKICYVGGSVTAGFGSSDASTKCWRAIVGKWFTDTFPDVKITNVNVSNGGLGSFPHSYRLREECGLDTEFPPDIVFLDSALNDAYDGISEEQVKVNVESIIRQIYNANPKATIIVLYMTDFGRKGGNYNQQQWTSAVADHYGLLQIDLGRQLWQQILADNDGKAPESTSDPAWTKYITDYCHPSDAGYEKYAEYVISVLNERLSGDAVARYHETHKDVVLPEKTYCEAAKIKDNGNSISFADAGFANAVPKGWRLDENGYLRPVEPGHAFALEFTGTAIGFINKGYEKSTALTYTITSKTNPSVKYTGTCSTAKTGAANGGYRPIEPATGLPLDTYRVEIRFEALPEGDQIELRRICINGDVSTVRPAGAAG